MNSFVVPFASEYDAGMTFRSGSLEKEQTDTFSVSAGLDQSIACTKAMDVGIMAAAV